MELFSEPTTALKPTRTNKPFSRIWGSTPGWSAVAVLVSLLAAAQISVKLLLLCIWATLWLEFVRAGFFSTQRNRRIGNTIIGAVLGVFLVQLWPFLKPKNQPTLDQQAELMTNRLSQKFPWLASPPTSIARPAPETPRKVIKTSASVSAQPAITCREDKLSDCTPLQLYQRVISLTDRMQGIVDAINTRQKSAREAIRAATLNKDPRLNEFTKEQSNAYGFFFKIDMNEYKSTYAHAAVEYREELEKRLGARPRVLDGRAPDDQFELELVIKELRSWAAELEKN
jgi:hypothetical protein